MENLPAYDNFPIYQFIENCKNSIIPDMKAILFCSTALLSIASIALSVCIFWRQKEIAAAFGDKPELTEDADAADQGNGKITIEKTKEDLQAEAKKLEDYATRQEEYLLFCIKNKSYENPKTNTSAILTIIISIISLGVSLMAPIEASVPVSIISLLLSTIAFCKSTSKREVAEGVKDLGEDDHLQAKLSKAMGIHNGVVDKCYEPLISKLANSSISISIENITYSQSSPIPALRPEYIADELLKILSLRQRAANIKAQAEGASTRSTNETPSDEEVPLLS